MKIPKILCILMTVTYSQSSGNETSSKSVKNETKSGVHTENVTQLRRVNLGVSKERSKIEKQKKRDRKLAKKNEKRVRL